MIKTSLTPLVLIGWLLFATPGCSTPPSVRPLPSGGEMAAAQKAQAELTPQQVLEMLIEGNREYAADGLTVRNDLQRIHAGAGGQYPMAAVLACIDSRVPVADIFHCGIGDLFVARVAGNIINEDILGSLEYACKVSGSKLVLVLGHERCGAIRSAIEGVEMGNVTTLLAKIEPAVEETAQDFDGDASAVNTEFVEAVCVANVLYAMEQVRMGSPILREMEERGEIMIVGGVYSLETGEVEFLQ